MEHHTDEDEVGTLHKILLVGCESGGVHLIDLRGRTILKSLKLYSAVNSVKFLNENTGAAGTQDGMLVIFSIPDMEIVHEIHDSNASVESLLPVRNGILCGKYDGACVWYGFDPMTNEICKEVIVLSGSDVDPINDMAKDNEYVYTAARDGCFESIP